MPRLKNNNKMFKKKKNIKSECPILASRREERKQAKLAKKQQNIDRHENKSAKGKKTTAAVAVAPEKKSKHLSDPRKEKNADHRIPQKVNKKREEEMRKQRVKQVRQQLKADDKVIKQMEKKLKLNRRKGRTSIPKSFYAEGLGDLLDLVDKRVDPDQDLIEEKDETSQRKQRDDYDEEDDFAMESGSDDGEQENEQNNDSDQDVDQEIEFDPESDSEDGDAGEEENDEIEVEESAVVTEPLVQEPEQLDETLLRRIRGQLNRITTSNLPSISSFIENMYRANSLYQVNESICRCMESLLVIDVTLSPLKLVTEMCLLIASLHENIGEEVGGHAIHYFVKRFKEEFDNSDKSMESKKLDNYVAIVCNLYAVSVMDSGLMYEIVNEIVSCFDEKSIELLLFILTSVGFLMRKDSPERMKNLIRDVQSKGQNSGSDSWSKRTEFMLETLTEIKNNNIMKVTSRSSSVVMPIDRDEVKSILKNCLKNSTKVSSIPATMQQVLTSNRWWIKVGPGLIEDQQIREAKDKVLEASKASGVTDIDFRLESESEERLCRKLRLNTTPLRRSLFKAVISASDYIEAADRLVALCNKSQCIEAANVVIQISIHETAKFNPFYFHVLKRLSSFDRRYKVSIFFAIRDRLSDVTNLSEGRKEMFASLIFHLVRDKVISLSVVKGLDFASLTEPLVIFMKSLLTKIMNEGEDAMREMFDRIPKKDHMLLTSLRLFISCFMDEKSDANSHGRDLMNARIRMATDS